MGGPSGTIRDAGILDARARGIVDPGTGDPGTESRIAKVDDEASDEDLRRADFRDAYREGMISRFTDESLAGEDIYALLDLARQASEGATGDWGPRTQYANAINLLTLYTHLLGRARASPRDSDGALLTKQPYTEKVVPWTPKRIQRVAEIPEFMPDKLESWNKIVALGPPPEYNPRRPWNGVRPPKVKEIVEYRPIPGVGKGAGVIELPMGMYAVIRPGGADARIRYKLLKTDKMNADSREGRKAIMEAVIAQILEHQQSEAYYTAAADEMLNREPGPRGAVYANDPKAFRKKSDTGEFTFEVGITFLMHLDDVTDGQVPARTMRLLEPGIDVRKHEPRPLWQELYPDNTRAERAFWVWKRMNDAWANYDPASGRPVPGHFYEGREMFYVADGNFVGDQIWVTKDARIFTVNERDAMLEGFRQGVLAAAGMVAVAYFQIALALILIELPAIFANIGRLITAPAASTKELLLAIRANPLKVLGAVALDQGAAFMLSPDKQKWLEDFGGAETWVQVFLRLLMLKDLRQINLPSGGGRFVLVGEELRFFPGTGTARDAVTFPGTPFEGTLVAGGETGKVTPEVPTTVQPKAPVAQSPKLSKSNAVADDGASVVIRTDVKPGETAAEAPRTAPETARDAAQKPAEAAGNVPRKSADPVDSPRRRGTTDAERANTGKQRGTEDEAQPVERDVDEDVDVDVADPAGGGRARPRSRREPGARGQSRGRRPEPPGGKRAIDGRSRGTGDRRGGRTERGRRGGGRAREEIEEADEAVEAAPDAAAGGAGKKGGGGAEPPRRGGEGGPPKRGKKGEPPEPPRPPAGRDNRAVSGNSATGEETITFTRAGVDYRIRVSSESRRAYDDIPVGDTVVYTVHDAKGEVIYIGISEKTAGREAINRLQEHLTTKDQVFIIDAREFRIVGSYRDPLQAHALEQSLVTSTPTAIYNKDQNPWLTFMDYYGARLERYGRWSRGLDDDLRNAIPTPRRKPVPDWESKVPEQLDRPIRFRVDQDLPTTRGPRPGREPGVDPDFDSDPFFDQ